MRTLKTVWGPQMYPVDLILIDNRRDFKRYCSDIAFPYPEKYGAWTLQIETNTGDAVLVVLGDQDSRSSVEEVFAHEAVHVWQCVKKIIVEGEPAIEQEAYAIEYYYAYLVAEYRYRKSKRLAAKRAAKKRASLK